MTTLVEFLKQRRWPAGSPNSIGGEFAPSTGLARRMAVAEQVVDGFMAVGEHTRLTAGAFSGYGYGSPIEAATKMLGGFKGTGLTLSLRAAASLGNEEELSAHIMSGATRVGSIRRTFSGATVEHDAFDLATASGKGLGRAIMKAQVAEYRRIGIKKITLNAGAEAGGYAWARYGFVPDKKEWTATLGWLTKKHSPATPQGKLLAALNPNKPEDIWLLADSAYGASILSGAGWRGSMALSNKAQRARFDAYVSAPLQKSMKDTLHDLDNEPPVPLEFLAAHRKELLARGVDQETIDDLYPIPVAKAYLLAKSKSAIAAMNAQLSALSGVPLKAPKGAKPAGTAQARWPKGSPAGKGGEWMGDGLKAAMAHVAYNSSAKAKGKTKYKVPQVGGQAGTLDKYGVTFADFSSLPAKSGLMVGTGGKAYAIVPWNALKQDTKGTVAEIPKGALGSSDYNYIKNTSNILRHIGGGVVEVVGKYNHKNSTWTIKGHGSGTATIGKGLQEVLIGINGPNTNTFHQSYGDTYVTLAANTKKLYLNVNDAKKQAKATAGKYVHNLPRKDFPTLHASEGKWQQAHAALTESFWSKHQSKAKGSTALSDAVGSYQASSSPINDHLRGKNTRAFTHSKEKKEAGIVHAKAMVDFFQSEGAKLEVDLPFPIYRGVSKSLFDVIAKSSAVWTDGGFLSMAMRPADSHNFSSGTLLRVKAPKKIRAIPAIRSDETELILDNRFGFRVIGKKVTTENYATTDTHGDISSSSYQVLDVELVDLSKNMKTVKKPSKKRVKKSDTSRFVSDEMVSGTEEEMAAYLQECLDRVSGTQKAKGALADRANNLR